ncbi:MAG: hypothetical protein WC326_11335 [Candidatus Delongbacteria bacterium]
MHLMLALIQRRWTHVASLLGALCLLSCASHFPAGTAGGLPFTNPLDSLFLSPVAAGQGGNFSMDRKLDKSRGQAEDYLRVWQSFLAEECQRRGLVLILPLRTDSLARSSFRCPLDAAAWRRLYGVEPGDDSRVLEVKSLRLQAVTRNWFQRLLFGLNLMDESDREFGWVELDYEVYDLELEEGSGRRLLVSREPDTPWISGMMDRAGRLMMKAARDLAREVDTRRTP